MLFPFGRREVAFKAVQQPVEHFDLPLAQSFFGGTFPEVHFTQEPYQASPEFLLGHPRDRLRYVNVRFRWQSCRSGILAERQEWVDNCHLVTAYIRDC